MYLIKKGIKILFPIHTKEILIVLTLLFILLFIQLIGQENSQIIDRVTRPNYFSGDEDVTLYYEDKSLGINEEAITFRIDKAEVIDKDIAKYLEFVSLTINQLISKQYDNFTHITGAIELEERYEQCKIRYELSPSKYINDNGWMNEELWREEETIYIKYFITFKEEEYIETIELLINKNSFTKEYTKAYLEENILLDINLLNENQESKEIVLPKGVTFYDKKNQNSGLMLFSIWLLLVISCSLIVYYEIKLKKTQEFIKRKVELTYFINSFTLLYQTGMTIQKSFLVTTNNRLLALNKEDPLYMDFTKIKVAMESDQKFHEVLKLFGMYFDIRECRRFIRLLLQTLKQGDDHLVEQLEYMTRLLWEERIRTARKESEKASSKLVFPMLLIFIVILIISIVPTFLEVKSIF